MRRIVTCAAVLLFVVACGSVYAKGGNGGGRPATAGAQAKGPKATKAPKTTTSGATNTARGKSSAPGQVKKAPTNVDGGTVVSPVAGPNVPKNPKLQARLQAKLPGMTLDEAAANFKNQGQFIAAVHAADRLGVDFAEFKAKMVDEGNSLGQTIQFFKPGADADAEASLAQSKAKQDLK